MRRFTFHPRLLAAALALFANIGSAQEAKNAPSGNKFRVLESQEVDLGNRSIIYNRVQTPVLKPQPAPTPTPIPRPPTAQELEMMRQWDAKADIPLFLSCTVYDHSVTEVRWARAGGEYVVWSSIDFNLLRGLGQFETATARYMFLLGIGNESSADVAAWNAEVDRRGLPAICKHQAPTLPADTGAGKATYKVISTPKGGNHAEVFKVFDELHRYYDANRARLVRNYEESEAARIAKEKWNREHPPIPQDTTINFFPIKSTQTGQPVPGGGK